MPVRNADGCDRSRSRFVLHGRGGWGKLPSLWGFAHVRLAKNNFPVLPNHHSGGFFYTGLRLFSQPRFLVSCWIDFSCVRNLVTKKDPIEQKMYFFKSLIAKQMGMKGAWSDFPWSPGKSSPGACERREEKMNRIRLRTIFPIEKFQPDNGCFELGHDNCQWDRWQRFEYEMSCARISAKL